MPAVRVRLYGMHLPARAQSLAALLEECGLITGQDTQRRCVFCGSSDELSGEHLLPDWMARVLPSEDEVLHFRQIGTDPATAATREWSRRPFQEKTNTLCRPCNNQWLSDLERRVAPVLTPLLRHQPSRLGTPQQSVLSAWALKTCLVLQGREPIAPASHFSHLRSTRLAPAAVAVWIGSNYQARFSVVTSTFVQRPLSLQSMDERLSDAGEFGYLNFLAIGAVSFLVIGHGFANRIDITLRGVLEDALIKIWPRERSVVAWPPQYMMDHAFIEDFTVPDFATLEARVFPHRDQ